MGWASATYIFDPVARALINAGVDDNTKTSVLTDLIRRLQESDWDTEDESLDEFKHDPAIVEAFRCNGVYKRCEAENGDDLDCNLAVGHPGNHQDFRGATWSAGLRQPQDVLRTTEADVRGTLQWQVHCPRCADASVNRGRVRTETTVDFEAGKNYSPVTADAKSVSIALHCSAGHAFLMTVANHKGAEYITIEP